PFDLEAVERAPVLLVGLNAGLAGGGGRDEQVGRSRVDSQVERALTVDLHPHHDVVAVGEAVGDLEGLGVGFLDVGRRERLDQYQDAHAQSRNSHEKYSLWLSLVPLYSSGNRKPGNRATAGSTTNDSAT